MRRVRRHRAHLRVLNAKLLQQGDELSEAERHTAEAQSLLETLVATAPVGVGFVDREFRIRHINEQLAAVNGAPMADQLGRTVAEVVPDLWPQIARVCRHVLDTGEAVVNQELSSPNPAVPGERRAWLASCFPVRENGEIIGIGLFVMDITERHEAGEFRSVVMDNMAEGLYVLDRDDRLTFMNAAASKILGWTTEELRGRRIHEVIHFQHADGSAFPEADCDVRKVYANARAVRVNDDAFTRRDGSIVAVAYSAAPLLNGTTVRGVVVVFRDITEERAERRRVRHELNTLTWVGRISEALDERRFVLYSQPIVPLRSGKPREELLLRMVGRNGEIVAPGSFLPVAEKYGLIAEIDRWVVREALLWAAAGRRVEVNLSAESVGAGSDLLNLIERELSTAGADPSNVVFEVTETALMANLDAAKDFTRGLTDLGCGVALDDFGTGFGSFNYLKHLAVGYLKIDTDFVRDLSSNSANQHLVRAIVSLARAFGQQTIAEGVEDAETLALLHEYGVDFAQGFHLGRPAPLPNDAPA